MIEQEDVLAPEVRKRHWEAVYAGREPEEFSWHQADPELSLELIRSAAPDRGSAIIDIGGGASRLVDRLLADGYHDLSVLDISAKAIEAARQRLGERSASVTWLETDVTAFVPSRRYRVWHDRAAFHFLTDPRDRECYIEVLEQALEHEGQVIITTFAIGGPTRCSGLEVVQYDAQKLGLELGQGFELVEQRESRHRTPAGAEQAFTFFRYRHRS